MTQPSQRDPPHQLADRIAPLLNLELQRKQEYLETLDPKARLEQVFERMLEEAEIKKLEKKLKERVQGQIGRTQKEYYLKQKSLQDNGRHGQFHVSSTLNLFFYVHINDYCI